MVKYISLSISQAIYYKTQAHALLLKLYTNYTMQLYILPVFNNNFFELSSKLWTE